MWPDLGSLFAGSVFNPTAASSGDMTQGWGATVTPGAGTPAPAGGGSLAQGLGALQGFKAPAPTVPIMSGGASGPSAPQMQMGGMQSSPIMNALMQFISRQNSSNNLRVPSLGSMLG